MLILPVIDLLGGLVVRGVAGRRSEYQPIRSQLVSDPAPASVARVFRERFEFSQCYVADLDAISGRPANFSAWQEIADTGLQLWLDAGSGTLNRLRELDAALPRKVQHRIVVGLESLASLAELGRMVAAIGPERIVFSLDLKQGELLTPIPELQTLSPLELAQRASALGVRQFILLDLANVGVNQGVGTLELCQQLHALLPQVDLIAGGGMRGLEDLQLLTAAGCSAALVASALHDLKLTAAECRAATAW